ncbi:MAG TPA: serine hydrolase domain-containing protein [Kofleriaceae bacterium]|nr:serine hydrolase domain-containing protein [Kofleriaceae bacterium]
MAARLGAAQVAALGDFVEAGRRLVGVPGAALGLISGGEVVLAKGFGVRALGDPAPVTAGTRFAIASLTKALTSLMLARLVDERRLAWDAAAPDLLPGLRIGGAGTARRVLVRHLAGACSGVPPRDLEVIFRFGDLTADGVLAMLGAIAPTSEPGAMFQYGALPVAAAGFLGGHVAFPGLELGAAYDEAMRTRVLGPLDMDATTLDLEQARTGDFAVPHAPDVDGNMVRATLAHHRAVVPVRPAGGAWSTVDDLLRYLQLELALGVLPDGQRYLSEEALLARRAPQVAIDAAGSYGMGLVLSRQAGATVVNHEGSLIGFRSRMMWLPEHGVGAVVLANGDGGELIGSGLERKLLEVVLGAAPEADAALATGAARLTEERAQLRARLEVPAGAAAASRLAARYRSATLGELAVRRDGAALVFDFGRFATEVAVQRGPGDEVAFAMLEPGIIGLFPFTVGERDGKRTLVVREGSYEHVLEET